MNVLRARGALTAAVLGAGLAVGSATSAAPRAWAQAAPSEGASGATAPAAAAQGADTRAPANAPSIETFMRIRTPGSPLLLADGSLLVTDWPDGVVQLYRAPGAAARAGEEMERLTNFADGLSGASLSPDGRRIVVSHAVGGNENTRLALLTLGARGAGVEGAALAPLMGAARVQASLQAWLRDSSGFIARANLDSPEDFHLYLVTLAEGGAPEVRRVLSRPGSWGAADVTDDKRRALVSVYRSASDSEVFELDLESGLLTAMSLTARTGGTASITPVGYMPGERAVALLTDAEDGVRRLLVRDLQTGRLTRPLAELARFDLDEAQINDARDMIAVVSNQDGYGVLSVYTLPDFRPVATPAMEKGVVGVQSFRGRTLVWGLSNSRTPGLAFATELDPALAANQTLPAGATRQLTFADMQGLDASTFPAPELVRYTSRDGLIIPAFLWMPAGAQRGTPTPFVINFHGGPEAQHRPSFDRTALYLVSRGFGLLEPNVRGSTGYGRAFQMADDYKSRWASVTDGVDAARFLAVEGFAAPGRIAGWGGSYGGFMATATLIEDTEGAEKEKRPAFFGAAITQVGIQNFETFLERTSGYRRKLREAEYGPLTDREFLRSVSPLHRADRINVPLMITHGLNDPRVPVDEAMQLAEALQRRDLDPELLFFHDEGHGLAKLDNRLLFAERMSRFLHRTIGAGAGPMPGRWTPPAAPARQLRDPG